MKQDYPRNGIMSLCRLFGKTRHAWYDHQWRVQDRGLKDEIVLQHVLEIRKNLPCVGTLKLHEMLKTPLETHKINIGRDYLFDLMREHNLHIRRRKRKAITTDSRHWMHKYANLIRELAVIRPEQLWVSDITYIRLINQFGYLSLITDAYSRKIMGYNFRKDLSAQGCIDALQMAFKARTYPLEELIHHSDRGAQYCSKDYVKLLVGNHVAISMTENGDPYENALAERVNGIIKTEFNLHFSSQGFTETGKRIEKAIQAYNQLRPHSSCDFLTPEKAHLKTGLLKKRWNIRKNQKHENTACIANSELPILNSN